VPQQYNPASWSYGATCLIRLLIWVLQLAAGCFAFRDGRGGGPPAAAKTLRRQGAINAAARIRQGKQPRDANDGSYQHATECTCTHLLLWEKEFTLMDGPGIDRRAPPLQQPPNLIGSHFALSYRLLWRPYEPWTQRLLVANASLPNNWACPCLTPRLEAR
jgi:hypothetical protein